jgi:hypothetical protein
VPSRICLTAALSRNWRGATGRLVAPEGRRLSESSGEAGQASLLLLGVVAALLAVLVVLFAFGQTLGAKGRHQRAADLAAISAAQVMRANYGRLFEPPLLPSGLPNPRHLSSAAHLALARAAARRGAVRNGLRAEGGAVRFPGGHRAANTRPERLRTSPARAASTSRRSATACSSTPSPTAATLGWSS